MSAYYRQIASATVVANPTLGAITEDRVAFGALIITSSGSAIFVKEIESMETEKKENGDAGTWSFTAPLAVNHNTASVIGPMDLVALYAVRIQADLIGQATAALRVFNLFPEAKSGGYTYGSAGASVIKQLGLDSANCLMIGMIDRVEEGYDFEASSLTLTVYGRDLTKVLIDNDVYVPYTVAAGGENGIASVLAGVSFAKETSGTQFLLDILDIFVAKNPDRIAQVINNDPNFTLSSQDVLQSIAQFGYPWRNFLRVDALIAGFHHIGNGQFPRFAVQNGSAWTNITELRNFPIARIFVDEIGRLIFDDTWSAWGMAPPATAAKLLSVGTDGNPRQPLAVVNSEVRSVSFSQADDNVLTGISIQQPLITFGDFQPASFPVFSAPQHAATSTIQVYGYRCGKFVSQYDDPQAYQLTPSGVPTPNDPTQNALAARYPILWQLHNNLWEATFVLKGNVKWRAGARLSTTLGGSQAATRPQTGYSKEWYIMSVAHSLSFGADWTTTVKARFPLDPAGSVLAANVVGGNAAPL